MGGYGSGRTGGGPLTQDCLRLDVAQLMRQHFIAPGQHTTGTLTWACTTSGSISARIGFEADLRDVDAAWMRVRRLPTTKPSASCRREQLRLVTTIPTYGGMRWWFLCPLSGRRVRVLYRPLQGECFASRQAGGLAYRSQRQTNTDRIIDKATAARRKLGADEVNLLGMPACPKPRGMRWHTHRRLVQEAEELVQALWATAPV
jgi:hypothetical protein